MIVELFLEDKTKKDRKGKFLASLKLEPIEGIPNRELANHATTHLKTWYMSIYNQSLIISIGE